MAARITTPEAKRDFSEAGKHAAWAEAFAGAFTAALPDGWTCGLKIAARPHKEPEKPNPLELRLKVWNGIRGDGDRRRWVYVTLGKAVAGDDIAGKVVAAMAAQGEAAAVQRV